MGKRGSTRKPIRGIQVFLKCTQFLSKNMKNEILKNSFFGTVVHNNRTQERVSGQQ